jgi:hypothetical protein
MRRGIHRGYQSDQEKPRRAWISEAPGNAGEWVTEAEYRAAGYSPEFDSLPMLVVRSVPVSKLDDRMCEDDKRFIGEWIEKKNDPSPEATEPEAAAANTDAGAGTTRDRQLRRLSQMTKDWRLQHLETQPFLREVTFVRKLYKAYSAEWDHDHCVACWMKFMEPGIEGPDIIHEGYATTAEFVRGADYEWVCPECFSLFREAMAWKEEAAN